MLDYKVLRVERKIIIKILELDLMLLRERDQKLNIQLNEKFGDLINH